MRGGRVLRLAALAALAVAAVATATAAADAKKGLTKAQEAKLAKLCPANRCLQKEAYDAKVINTRRRLARDLKVDLTKSRHLPTLTLLGSAKCRENKKVVQPLHICWKVTPQKAFSVATARVRAIIIRDEKERTGNCAKCSENGFLLSGGCCRPECLLINRLNRGAEQSVLRLCCGGNQVKCAVLKKDVAKKGAAKK